jgi:translocation and assembly module TamB
MLRIIITATKWSATIVLIFILTLCSIFIFAQTEYGKDRLIGFATFFLNEKYDTNIEADGLTGIVPYNIKIDYLTFHDKSGIWLDIRNLTFRFSPLYLFKGRLLIRELRADSVTLDHLPHRIKSDILKSKRPFSWPTIIYHIGLERLNIISMSLGKDILGKPASFRIEAGITNEKADVKSSLSINVDRTDGGVGSAFVHAEIKGSEPYLTIDAGIEEPEEGLIGAMLGIRTPLYMTMKGSGSIKNWGGKLLIKANELTEIDAQVRLHSIKDLNLDLDGTVIFYSGIIPKYLADLFEPETQFKITSHMKGENNLFLDLMTMESENASIELKGMLDMKDMTSEGSLAVNLKDISPLGQLIDNKCSGRLTLSGDFKGLISSPALNLELTIRNLKTDMMRSDEFRAKALVELISEDNSSAPFLHIAGKGNILGLYVPSLSDSLPEKHIVWDLDMTGPDKGLIKLKNLQLTGNVLSAKVSGVYNKEKNNGSFDALLSARSLEKYSSLLKVDLPPGIGIQANIKSAVSKNSFNSHISGRLIANGNSDDSLINIIAPEIKYSGNLEVSEAKVLKFSNIRIDSDKAGLTGSGSYDLNEKLIHGLLNLETDNLAGFSSLLKRDIGGSAKIEASIDGLIDMLNLKAEARAKNLTFGHERVQDISISIVLTGGPLKNEGQFSLLVDQQGYNLKGHSAFKLDNKVLSLKNILFEGAGLNLNGDLSYDMDNALAEGKIHGECKDLSVLTSLFSKEIQGAAGFNMKLNPVKGKNLINLNLQAKDISGMFGSVGSLDIKMKLSGDLQSPEITLVGSLLGFENKNLFFKKIDLNATGNPHDLAFTVKGTGRAGYDIQIETAGDLSFSSLEQSLAVNWLHGEYGVIPFDLIRAFKVTRSEKVIELESMELNLAGGTLDASGKFSDNDLHLNLNLNEIPVSLLQLAGITELEGNATGSIILSGTLKLPEARAQFILNNLRLRDPQYAKLPPFRLTLLSELNSDRLQTDLSLDSLTGNPFKLEMDIPLALSLSPFSWTFPENGDLKGRLSGQINLENIASLAGFYDQLIMGSLNIDFDLSGIIKSPRITGHAGIENGSYENISTGTYIKNIKADITSDSSRFILNHITGEDATGGTISGKGWFDFAPSKDFPYEISLNMNHMTFIRSDTSSLTFWGTPSLSGTIKDHILKGKLSVEKGDFRIPERLPAEITDLEVTEINGPEQEQAQKRSAKKSVMKLDLSVESEGQVYLTGRGLNSEWKGNLIIKGTTVEPVITGRLLVLRGSYNFFGKRFTLTKGLIDLDGQYPLSPYLDVTGEAKTSEITAIINLTGDIRKPEITLTSEPTLPSDEILSQLLFGREVSQISPLQAIELGNALNTMLGKSSYDIVGRTRKILGVDQLELKQSGESVDGATVSVGKYLIDSLYIEVEKGLGAESNKASVTWEATPNISIDTEIGENASTGVGVNWKWDY